MILTINPTDPRPIYVQITDEIRRAIVVGTLLTGDSLPSVRALAGELRVNPNTVRQAYRELERDGVVYVRRGQGTYVANSGMPAAERRRMIGEVVFRALRDAHRHGLTAEELIDALQRETVSRSARVEDAQKQRERA
jgi:GntR family transcriptional regulator